MHSYFRRQRNSPGLSLSNFVCISWRKLDEEEMLEGVTLYSTCDNGASIYVHNSPMVSLHIPATTLKTRGNTKTTRPEAEFFDKKSRQKSWEFSSLLFTVTSSTVLPWDFYYFKLTQPLTVSKVQLLYTAKEKGGKPDRKPRPLPSGFRNLHTETSSLKLSGLCPKNLNWRWSWAFQLWQCGTTVFAYEDWSYADHDRILFVVAKPCEY